MSGRTAHGLQAALSRVNGVLGQLAGLPATRGPARRLWLRQEVGRNQFVSKAGSSGLRGDSSSGLRGEELARLEAALFLAREPLTTRRLARLARLPDATRARALLRELRSLQEASGSAIRVEPVAGGFQLFTRASFGPWVKRLLETPPGTRLSGTALETLAIVAYRQPITRAEIEAIRGAGSEEMLRQLMERDLVAIGGRAEELGRPNVYVTTRRFLAFFGLSRLEDLPELAAILPAQPAADVATPSASDGGTP
jgi:segregation and condensation protein B